MKKSTILCALLLLSLSASEAFGCVCELEPNTTPEKIRAARLSAFEKATVVFSGEVVAKDLITVKFKVDKMVKRAKRSRCSRGPGIMATVLLPLPPVIIGLRKGSSTSFTRMDRWRN